MTDTSKDQSVTGESVQTHVSGETATTDPQKNPAQKESAQNEPAQKEPVKKEPSQFATQQEAAANTKVTGDVVSPVKD